jgi:hypothetical protein
MNSTRLILVISLLTGIITFSCKKSDVSQSASSQLSYGDSIFYIQNQTNDVIVSPVNPKTGIYSSFPQGLVIEPTTGVINVSQSESGIKYRINFQGQSGDSSTTYVIISGINFPDHYYRIESADTMALPVYNANPANVIPTGSFDDDHVANNSGCAIKTDDGKIDLAESIRNGLFGDTPKNNTRKDFEVKYRLDDRSGKAQNKIKIQIYYYDRMSDVPQSLQQTVQDHQAMTILPNNSTISSGTIAASAKPRPPCIVVIGHNN